MEATAHLEEERRALDPRWHRRLERAASEAERAARHDRLIEPEPRVVARQLAKEWEDTLLTHRHLQAEDARVGQAQPPLLSRAEREPIAPWAQPFPALWQAPTTTMAERQALVRQILPRVSVAGEGRSEQRQMTIEGGGGGRTPGLPPRPISHIAHLRDEPRVCERIRPLVHEGHRTVQLTALLAHEGFRAPKHARPFSRQSVIGLMRRLERHQRRPRRRPPLQAHEWWWSDWERELGQANSTLHQWRTRGWLHARWHDYSQRWVAGADAAERPRLKQQRCALPPGEASGQRWRDAPPSQPPAIPPLRERS